MKIADRYASATHSSNLSVDQRTTWSDTDVLGAMGLAAITEPLAVALSRLFAGDNNAAYEVTILLADMARNKAKATFVTMSRVQSEDMAKACLAWWRHGTCDTCDGHGLLKIPGSTTIGTQVCPACRATPSATFGTGRMPFEKQFRPQQRPLATWLQAEMMRSQSRAGPEAMKKLAPSLDL